MNWLLNHLNLLPLASMFLLPLAPKVVKWAEGKVLSRLLSAGDEIDQEYVRAIVRATIVWAEKRCQKEGAGGEKFKQVDGLLAKAIPFLTAEQRKALIENGLEALDAEAKAQTKEP